MTVTEAVEAAYDRYCAAAPQGLGALVFPSSVADLQEKLFNDFVAVDHDVTACTGLDAATRSNWLAFVASFEAWYNVDPYTWTGYWTAGNLYDQGLQLQTQLISWQAQLKTANCTLTEPDISPPPAGVDWSSLKFIAASIAVVAVAFVAFPVVTETVAAVRAARGAR